MSAELESAIVSDDPVAAASAIKGFKNLDKKLPGGSTPIALAAEKGAARALAVLLDAGAKVKFREEFPSEHPFVVAARKKHHAVMELLVSRNDVPAHVIELALMPVAKNGDDETYQFILQKCHPPITAPIIRVALYERRPSLIRILAAAGADFNVTEKIETVDRVAPLHKAVDIGVPECIQILVESGANINGQDSLGCTPLMILGLAAYEFDRNAYYMAYLNKTSGRPPRNVPSGSEELFQLLIKLGADASIKDIGGHDAIDYYRISWHLKRSQFTGRENFFPNEDDSENTRVIDLLKSAGAVGHDPTVRLHTAKSIDDFKKAIADGADVNWIFPDQPETTPLAIACKKGDIDRVAALIAAGADVNKPNYRGDTPLMEAAHYDVVPIAEMLIKAGANLHARQPEEYANKELGPMTAYMIAEWLQQKKMRAYLKSIGGARPADFKPITTGIHSTEDFSDMLAKGDVAAVSQSLAKMIGGKVDTDVYDKTFKLDKKKKMYIVVRPKGLAWCNILQVSPPLKRFDTKTGSKFCEDFAKSAGLPTISIYYDDASDEAETLRFEPNGKPVEYSGALDKLATAENFAAGALALSAGKTELEILFPGYPPEAFDGIALVTG